MNARTLERVGAIAGIVFVALFVSTFFLPSTPDSNAAVSEVQQNINDGRTGHLLSVYLGALAVIPFTFFLVALWRRLRDGEGDRPGVSVVALVGGTLMLTMMLVTTGVYLALIYGASEGAAVSALAVMDNTFFIGIPFALAIMLSGVAASALVTRALPAWLGWSAAVIAVALVIGPLGIFDPEEEGGAIGVLIWFGFLATIVWILAASITMLVRGLGVATRSASPRGRTPSPRVQPT